MARVVCSGMKTSKQKRKNYSRFAFVFKWGVTCGLHSILLQVRDLGLGYDSDETILFKYCSGTCPRVRSNHDLTLTNLLLTGLLPSPVLGELWHNAPCCRPTHHEDVAFLDNSHRWHKVEKLSAAGCSCVG
uniref:Artemin n=1 Tax=Haplochromis burtoni TaxID=8153 RepID=A0A3Q2WVT5_HAPBU